MLKKYTIKVKAKAKLDNIKVSEKSDVDFEISVKTAPEQGKANLAVIKTLAKYLGIAPSNCSLIKGEKSRTKTIIIDDGST